LADLADPLGERDEGEKFISMVKYFFQESNLSASIELLAEILNETSVERSVWASLVQANLHFRGSFGVERNCSAALEHLLDAADEIIPGYLQDAFGCVSPLEKVDAIPSSFGLRTAVALESELLTTKNYANVPNQFFCQLHHPEVERLLSDVITRPHYTLQSRDGPVMAALLRFRASSGNESDTDQLLSALSPHMVDSVMAQTVIATLHLFNETAAADPAFGRRVLDSAIAFNGTKALEVAMWLSLFHPLFRGDRKRYWRLFDARKASFNPIVSGFFSALLEGDCEPRYKAMRKFIDNSWVMTDGRLAEILLSANQLDYAQEAYSMLALAGNVEAMWNLHLLLRQSKNESANLLKLLVHEPVFHHLEFNSNVIDDDEVFSYLHKMNANSALRRIWLNRTSLNESMGILDELEAMKPEMAPVTRVIRWMLRVYHIPRYLTMFAHEPSELLNIPGVMEGLLGCGIVLVLAVLIAIRIFLYSD